ncbi:MAG: N-acetyl-gamma-glutamyl-phosphate reductase [Propionibacteriaceae bacterium]|nr:N-acetyl-gamma-glutamyl-phosphate reductase [Propionibacteriaceae bacterium]
MTFTVAVAGATGYAGGELLRVLLGHPEARIGALTAHSNVGDTLGQHQPHLLPLADRVLLDTTARNLAGHDVIALALPHGASGAIAAELAAAAPDAILIDLGADHRLESGEDWRQFYGGEYQGAWVYGMPELILGDVAHKQRQLLPGAKRLAVPGCNVTAVTLALAPGIAAGVIEPTDLVAVLANGLSGAGKVAKPHLLAAEVLGAASPYSVAGTHRHIPEIEQNLRKAGAGALSISFTPTLVPMSRGILATCTARLAPGVTPAQVRDAWQQAYDGEPFVRLLPDGQWPSTAMTLGANTALIQVAVDQRAHRVVAICAIDNLVKGTAGAAVQSLNLALGLPETTGLTTIGVAP